MPCQRLVCPQDDQEITRKRPPKDKVLPWQELSVDDEDLRNRQLAGFEDVKGQSTQKVDEEQACQDQRPCENERCAANAMVAQALREDIHRICRLILICFACAD